MFALRLAAVMASWMSLDAYDVEWRLELAVAIAWEADTALEARVLARVAVLESGLVARVARCDYVGAEGTAGLKPGERSLGAFQVVARNSDERAPLCGSASAQVAIAAFRVRESLAICRHLADERDRLSGYTDGHCHPGCDASRARFVQLR